ncbi:MAG: peptidase C14, caspase catalytic subunit p20 [candidate division WS6 bacterium GW2011_GWA2_37_6]|uniref:Peptidase C14, caspase catalytic subunit p20 n=1 Tax=candidate division WS6 bacterium GW2011_GWA2_37_6 TaxID=1619087 RepID=A0A0G0H6N5_9BACT|nr:MAG: peptidase C14, caspase catalytic subunit p20 [candidate division WS6 bacterium GW2011_GWA2_37_6]
MKNKLKIEIINWKHWAKGASKEEDGWESDYPNWNNLISTTTDLIENSKQKSEEELKLIEFVLKVSEETEDLIPIIKINADKHKEMIQYLISSVHWEVRWQICECLSNGNNEYWKKFLISALDDKNEYVQRRALLALNNHDLNELEKIYIKKRFEDTKNKYISKIVTELS